MCTWGEVMRTRPAGLLQRLHALVRGRVGRLIERRYANRRTRHRARRAGRSRQRDDALARLTGTRQRRLEKAPSMHPGDATSVSLSMHRCQDPEPGSTRRGSHPRQPGAQAAAALRSSSSRSARPITRAGTRPNSTRGVRPPRGTARRTCGSRRRALFSRFEPGPDGTSAARPAAPTTASRGRRSRTSEVRLQLEPDCRT